MMVRDLIAIGTVALESAKDVDSSFWLTPPLDD
jgi:hypothetical protein